MPDRLPFRPRPEPRDCGLIEVQATGETVIVRLHPRRIDDPSAQAAVRRGDAMLIGAPMILVPEFTIRANW